MKKLSIGILGGGAVTRIYYIPAFRQLENIDLFNLCCVVDTSLTSLQRLNSIHKDIELVNASFEEFLNSSQLIGELDALIIALPNHLHESAVCLSLERGLHVLCEKPVTLSSDALSRMLKVAKRTEKIFAVSQIRRHYSAALAIREIIQSKMFGICRKISWLEGSRYKWSPESLSQLRREHGGEELFDIGAHVFDLLCWWLGELEVISYKDDSRGGAGADFHIVLQSMKDTEIKIRLSRISDLPQKVTILFEEGTIKWCISESNNIYVTSPHFPLGKGKITFGTKPDSHIDLFVKELVTFGKAIEKNGFPTVSGTEAALYVSVFDNCNSLRPSSQIVKIEDKMSWPWDNRNIAVTGASGFIGCRLVEIAMGRGFKVHALVHQPRNCVRLARNNVQMSVSDIMDLDSFKETISKASAVFHCAYGLGSSKNVHDTIVRGTENVLRAAAENSVKIVVILGSMLAYGNPPNSGIVTEETAINRNIDNYGIAKQEMTRSALEFGRCNGLKVVILEPTCVFGPFSRAFVTSHVERMLSNNFYFIEEGRGIANVIYVDNLVDVMLLSAASSKIVGQHFIVNEEENSLTWRDYFRPIYKALRLKEPPSISKASIFDLIRQENKQKSLFQLFRESIRNHREARERIARNPLFQAWKNTQRLLGIDQKSMQSISNKIEAIPEGPSYQFLKFIPDETFVHLFDTQAMYSSQAIRQTIGWTPQVKFPEALQETVEWVKATWPLME